VTNPSAGAHSRDRERLLTHVKERDIDLLLLEELYASRRFQAFLYTAGAKGTAAPDWDSTSTVEPIQSSDFFGPAEFTDPDSGVTSEVWGESDLDVLFTIGTAPVLFLVENKIDASFTPQQAKRYRSRAQLAMASGKYFAVRTLLVAPAAFLASSRSSSVFDARLSYEEIVAFLQSDSVPSDSEEARRIAFRLRLLATAIAKQKRGDGPQIVHPGVTSFRVAFGERSRELAPELGPINLKREGHWSGDKWIEYRSVLPGFGKGKNPDIVVKTDRKVVHLQIYGWGRRDDELRPRLAGLIEAGMSIPPVKGRRGSLAVSLPVSLIEHMGAFEPQRAAAEEAIRAAQRLLTWFQRHEATLREMDRGDIPDLAKESGMLDQGKGLCSAPAGAAGEEATSEKLSVKGNNAVEPLFTASSSTPGSSGPLQPPDPSPSLQDGISLGSLVCPDAIPSHLSPQEVAVSSRNPTPFGTGFAQRLRSHLMAGGWEESKIGGTVPGQFWSKARDVGPVHKIWVSGDKHPVSLLVRLYVKTPEAREDVRQTLDAARTPLPALDLSYPKSQQKDPRCKYALDLTISAAALGATPGMGDAAMVADHVHDLIHLTEPGI